MIIDDPFSGKEIKFGLKDAFKAPSRSPSPVVLNADVSLKDIDFKDSVFLEDNIQL